MDNDDWNIFSIVRSCNAASFTTPTTTFETPSAPEIQTTNTIKSNNIISYQNTTPFSLDDFTFTQENCSVPFTPLKPTDFIDLDKLFIKLNPTTTPTSIPTPTTTSIPTIITTATSSPTTIPTLSTNIIPTHITNINTSVHASNQNSTFFDFPELIEQQQMQSNESIELKNLILKFNPSPTTTITTPNINAPPTTTPTSICPITTTTTSTTPTTTIITSSNTTTHIIPTITTTMSNTSVRETNQYPSSYNFPMLIEQQHIQTKNKNQVSIHEPVACIEITTSHFGRAHNHPSIPKQPTRKSNRPPILLPETSSRVLPNTQQQQSNCETRKRKNDNQVVCYVTADKLSEDTWAWRKYGEKPIKGSPHPRSYYKCSTFTDCFARKQVEKSKTKENTYIVTYKGEHNHNKPTFNKNHVVGTSKRKPSETRLPAVREAESSPNIKKVDLPNVVMLRFDQSENNNSQVLVDQSKIPYLEKELIESQSHAAVEVGSSLNVENLDSHNIMMLQFDDSESNAQVFPSESRFIGSSDDEDNILIPNITAMSEDLLLNFNHLNKGVLFP